MLAKVLMIMALVTAVWCWGEENSQDSLADYRNAVQAFREKNYPSYLSEIRKAVQKIPNHPSFVYHLAKALALNGKTHEALDALDRVAKLGEGIKIEEEEAFTSIFGTPNFTKIARQFAQNRQASGSSQIAFEIPARDLIPEGIAYDPVEKVFYLSSTYRRKIVSVNSKGLVADFTKEKQDGLWGVLGMEVDVQRRHLWAVSSNVGDEMQMVETDPESVWHTALHQYDLRTGKLINKYLLTGSKKEQHGFNDLVIASNGDVFVTDSASGGVYVIPNSKRQLELLIRSGVLTFPNGIALSRDEKKLYVAHVEGVSVLDRVTGKLQSVSGDLHASLSGIDGMVLRDGDLIAIQGMHGADRIIRIHLTDDGMRIKGVKVLQQNHPLMNLPTTGVVADDSFYYIANSQLRSFDEKGKIFPEEKLQPVVILKVKVNDDSKAVAGSGTGNAAVQLLKLHEEERRAHFETNIDLLQKTAPDQFISVANGKIYRVSKSEEKEMFEQYFKDAKYLKWDDLEPPIVKVSADGTMGWVIVRLEVRRLSAQKKEEGFIYAGIMTYEKQDGKWLRVANVSTFEKEGKSIE